MKKFLIAAIRGRPPTNSDKSYEQKLEIKNDSICNTLTCSFKDNLLVEVERLDVKEEVDK